MTIYGRTNFESEYGEIKPPTDIENVSVYN